MAYEPVWERLVTPLHNVRSESVSIRSLLEHAGIQQLNEMQTVAIPRVHAGSNVLIVAPTGAGKTEAALFPVLESLAAEERGGMPCEPSTGT
jgi:Lhr-like helicase